MRKTIRSKINVFLFTMFCLSLFSGINVTDFSSNEVVRTINSDIIEEMGYEDYANHVLDQYDYFETSSSGTTVGLDGTALKSAQDYYGIEYLSSDDDQKLTVNKNTSFDFSTGHTVVEVNTSDELGYLLENYVVEVWITYDSAKLDYIVSDKNGDYISLFDVIVSEKINDCILSNEEYLEFGGGGGLGVLVLVALTPLVVTLAVAAAAMIAEVASNWYEWFKTKFQTATSIFATTTTHRISLSGITYKFQAVTKADIAILPQNEYRLALADTEMEMIYFSTVAISESIAIGVLSMKTANQVSSLKTESTVTFVLSTWTAFRARARIIAQAAMWARGFTSDIEPFLSVDLTPSGLPNEYGNDHQLRHFHPAPTLASSIGTPHSFFEAQAI